MEKNYYEILEIDRNASKEIIDKAYKTLAKKYHPDLQKKNVKACEEKMKKINEAYAVLTNEEQREAYNQQLEDYVVPIEEYHQLLQENKILKEKLNEVYNPTTNINKINVQIDAEEMAQHSNLEQTYRINYIKDIRKHINKKTIKEYEKNLIAVLLTILIFIIIIQIPFEKKFFEQIYDDNVVIQTIVKIFKSLLKIQD